MSAVPMNRMGPRARAKARSRAKTDLVNRAIVFSVIVGLTYLASSLAGQVMVEKARLESIRATDRALEARKVVGEIENRLNEMTNLDSVDEWARAHNFLSIQDLEPAPGTVAVAAESPMTSVKSQASSGDNVAGPKSRFSSLAQVPSAEFQVSGQVSSVKSEGSSLDQIPSFNEMVSLGAQTSSLGKKGRRNRRSRRRARLGSTRLDAKLGTDASDSGLRTRNSILDPQDSILPTNASRLAGQESVGGQ